MNATDEVVSRSATLRATVDFPEPDPPAIPMIKGLSMRIQSYAADAWNALCFFHGGRFEGTTMRARIFAASLALLVLAACNGLRHGSGAMDPNAPTVVQVDNQAFLDMAVYAVRSSQRVRLGTANGNRKTNLTVPPGLISGLTPLRFVADPIGATRASVSEEITVAPGDTVVLTIPPA